MGVLLIDRNLTLKTMENKVNITNLSQSKNLLAQLIGNSDKIIKTEKTGDFYAVTVERKKIQYNIYCTHNKTAMDSFISGVKKKWQVDFSLEKEKHPDWEQYYKGFVSCGMSSLKEIGDLYVLLWTVQADTDFAETLEIFYGKKFEDLDFEVLNKKLLLSFIFTTYLAGTLMIVAGIILFGTERAAYAIGRSGAGIEVPNPIVALIFLGIGVLLLVKKYSRSMLLFLMAPIILGVFSLITGMDRSFFNNPELLVQIGAISLITFIIILTMPMNFGRTDWKDLFEK